METFITIISGVAGGALITGIFSLLLFALKRKAKKRDKSEEKQKNFCQTQGGKIDEVRKTTDAHTIALRAVLYYIIKAECLKHIELSKITAKDLEDLTYMHGVYHDPEILNGNGFLDELMGKVKKLRIVENYED